MRVLVCGGRDYDNWQKVHALLDSLHARYGITKIIQGCARGADYAAWSWANLHGIPVTGDEYKPDWDAYGRKAGIMRNVEMHEEEVPHLVVGFPGDRGTAHMTEFAAERGTPTLIVPDIEWEEKRRLMSDDALDDVMIDDGEDDVEILRTKPWWLRAPTTKDKWSPRYLAEATPAGRYDADVMF